MELQSTNVYEADNYKADSRKTDTFFAPQLNFLSKTNFYKVDTTYIFIEELLFTMFYSLVYIFKNFFHSVLCPLIALAGPKLINVLF